MNKKEKLKNLIKFSLIGLLVVATIILTIVFFPKIKELIDKDNQDNIVNKIRSYGAWGWFIFLLIQIVQVVISIIPGEPIEVIGGVIYGSFGGLLTCMLGCLIGSVIVYYLSMKIGKSFIKLFVKDKDLKEVKFLKNEKRVEELVFLFYFIPGTPKDLITYLAPYTKIKPIKFFLISTFARIPSIITSTWAGSSISKNNWGLTIGVFGGTFAIALIGLFIRQKFFNKKDDNTEDFKIED